MTESLDIAPNIARRMIRSLTRGTTVADGARYIHVGHESWIGAQRELFDEIADDGGSETKFVRGAYGSGKSHFLVVIQDIARDNGWATSHVECKVDGVQIDRFETLYPKLVKHLRTHNLGEYPELTSDDLEIDPIRALLDEWSNTLLHAVGIRKDAISRPFDAVNRIYERLEQGLVRSNLPSDFTKALASYVRATEAADAETKNAVVDWMKGGHQLVHLPKHYLGRPVPGQSSKGRDRFELRPLGAGTAAEALRGLLWLIRNAGHPGLILCIDEVEELSKLPTRKRRDQALQALREHVDNAGGESGYRRLCLYLAATPPMFDNPEYFPRYDALQTRIAPVSEEINWRAPVIDLDRTPLDLLQMKEVARRIRDVHRAAYGLAAAATLSEAATDPFVDEVARSRFRIAKPRLLARVVVDELERARQGLSAGKAYATPVDLAEIVSRAAERISKEADA
jgi:P-loop Domain of unknown function (DUF2791)